MLTYERLTSFFEPAALRHFFSPIGASHPITPDVSKRLETAFRETERTGLMFASLIRAAIILGLVAFFGVTGELLGNGVAFLLLAPLGFVLIGAVQFEAARRLTNATWIKYVLISIDCGYLAAMLILRHSFADDLPPVTLSVKEGGLLFFTAFLVHGAFSYSPRFILWIGLCISLAWLAVLGAATLEPGVHFLLPSVAGEDSQAIWRRYGDITYLPFVKIVYDYVIVVLLTGGLAAAVWRSRRLVTAAALAERARANLARHFSPNVVDLLSQRDKPFAEVCWQHAAVLFADIRGFTARCESMAPGDAIEFLRNFHSRMEACIFDHHGTLDKVMGDGLIAVFGMPEESESDASNALACAFDMLRTIERWNEARVPLGQFEVRIGIGLHYGNVMLGDVGSERLMTFTVVGDTVNVASRLETFTKELGVDLVASESLVIAAQENAHGTADGLVAKLRNGGTHRVRGREHDINLLVYKEPRILRAKE